MPLGVFSRYEQMFERGDFDREAFSEARSAKLASPAPTIRLRNLSGRSWASPRGALAGILRDEERPEGSHAGRGQIRQPACSAPALRPMLNNPNRRYWRANAAMAGDTTEPPLSDDRIENTVFDLIERRRIPSFGS